MVLHRDAPVEVDFDVARRAPNDAEVKRLFDFLEFRALYDRMYEALGTHRRRCGGSGGADVVEPESAGSRGHRRRDCRRGRRADRRSATLDAVRVVGGRTGPQRPHRARRRHRRRRGRRRVDRPRNRARAGGGGGTRSTPRAARPQRKGADALVARPGRPRPGLRLDTQIAAYLIDPADTHYALRDLLARYTKFQLPDDVASASGQLDPSAADPTNVRSRRAKRSAVAHLSAALEASLDKQGMAKLYSTIENPLVSVLAKMEHVGIAVDVRRADAS